MDSDMGRRQCLKTIFATSVAAPTMFGACSIGHRAAAQNGPTMDSADRNKLILLLRRRGVRGGLDAKIGAILGLYNRGQNILVARMSVRRGAAILTFGRIVTRNKELYYWGFQPDVNVMTAYFFLTGWEFKLVARAAERMDGQVVALSPERGATIFAEVIKDWITILDAT
jgi:hypothetical protein